MYWFQTASQKTLEKACQSTYPLHDVYVRKVKMLKKPNFELGKLMALRGEGSNSGKATGEETMLKLNEPMDMNHQSKNLFKIQTFNGDKLKKSHLWCLISNPSFLNNLSLVNQMFWTDGDVNFSELAYGFYPLLLVTK